MLNIRKNGKTIGGEKFMPEEVETQQPTEKGPVGKLERDSANPEFRSATIGIEIIVTPDGSMFFDRQSALDYEALRREKEGR